MCFGGSSTPAAPTETPAVPVDQISAGQPTITVAPSAAAKAAASATPGPSTPASSQVSGGGTGLNM